MFILLGSPDDPCLTAVGRALEARSREALILSHPFLDPASTTWRFDSVRSESVLKIGGEPIPAEGVLVARRPARHPVDSDEWSRQDWLYNEAEAEAALLGWLWGLPCPVIDRQPAWLWYHTRRSVLVWGPLLRQHGLPPLDGVITGCGEQLSRFLKRQGGAAIEQTQGDGARQIVHESDAVPMAEAARIAPLRLTGLHEGAWRASIAGRRLVWDDATPAEAQDISPRLCAFAAAAGLAFAEFIVTSGSTPRMVEIAHRPRFELFGARARSEIAEGLAEALTREHSGSNRLTATSRASQ
jgi:hypothetical protein